MLRTRFALFVGNHHTSPTRGTVYRKRLKSYFRAVLHPPFGGCDSSFNMPKCLPFCCPFAEEGNVEEVRDPCGGAHGKLGSGRPSLGAGDDPDLSDPNAQPQSIAISGWAPRKPE